MWELPDSQSARIPFHRTWPPVRRAFLIAVFFAWTFVASNVCEAYDARAMHFEYEITADEFVASQLLYHKLSGGPKHSERALQRILVGSIFIAIAWNGWCLKWNPHLVSLL